MADWNALTTQTEKRILREVGLEVIALSDKARGQTPEQHGQRRMAMRVVALLALRLDALGDTQFFNTDGSWSEDTIDKDLIA